MVAPQLIRSNRSNDPPLLENAAVAECLEEVAELLAAKETNPYRVRAYRVAANTVRNLARPLHEILAAAGTVGLTELPGIGDSIAHAVEQLIATGTFPLLEKLRGRAPVD
jgi:DNA polymerase (family 10)